MKPTIRDKREFGLEDCPDVPTYEAGYLVSNNGGWRNRRPVLDEDACIGCLQCYLYCPDGAISKVAREPRPTVAIDYDFCKGCGICVKMCKPGCLHMEDEPR